MISSSTYLLTVEYEFPTVSDRAKTLNKLFTALKQAYWKRISFDSLRPPYLKRKALGISPSENILDSAALLVFEPGWRSGYRAGLEIQKGTDWAMPETSQPVGLWLAGVRVPSPAPLPIVLCR